MLVAQALLDELARTPVGRARQQAGYTTDVRGGMSVGGPGPRDPEDTLRLSTSPAELSSYALAQIVCTFSDSARRRGRRLRRPRRPRHRRPAPLHVHTGGPLPTGSPGAAVVDVDGS